MKTRPITRRSFLGNCVTAATALFSARFAKPMPSLFAQTVRPGNPLQIPPEWAGGSLVAAPAEIEVWPGQHASIYAINGSVPGPTIRVRKGRRFRARVENQLAEDLVIHWHGILSPPGMDGHPRDAVGPGGSYDVDFRIQQRGGSYWYHAHTDRLTGKQIYFGLAGLFIVEDSAERRLKLPRGVRDVPLMIQDRRTHGEPHIAYEPDMTDIAAGFLGDTVFVNNTPDAVLSVERGLYRFRLVNASNARVYRLGLADERPVHLIANDAGFLKAPVEVTTIMLAPGQRAEILVDFGRYAVGEAVVLKSHPFETGGGHGGGEGGGEGGEHRPQQGMELDVLTFYVDGERRGRSVIPRRLAPVRTYKPERAVRTRVFNLEVSDVMHPINGSLFDVNRIDEAARFGDLEVWEYRNMADELHPMHPHGALFQVLERHGTATLPPEDVGWKDTVLVHPDETISILIRFNSYAGVYVHHCHNLEHEDNGMMQNVEVMPRRESNG